MLLLPARNHAPGNVALVLSPPRTRSLPGAFFCAQRKPIELVYRLLVSVPALAGIALS